MEFHFSVFVASNSGHSDCDRKLQATPSSASVVDGCVGEGDSLKTIVLRQDMDHEDMAGPSFSSLQLPWRHRCPPDHSGCLVVTAHLLHLNAAV